MTSVTPRPTVAVLAAWLVTMSTAAAQTPLTAGEVLASVDRAWPVIEQARRDVDAAAGDVTSAAGAFDLNLRGTASSLNGDYDNQRLSALVEQPFAALGLTTYGGVRVGRGDFASYDAKADTKASAELVAGLTLPLLRGRAIDARRADRDIAALGRERADEQLDTTRLTAFRTALVHYWDWVAAGHQRDVARTLLALAEARDRQLEDAVALGQIAPIERTDNRRAILQRRSALIAAERLLEQKAIDLSLFLRGPDGAPQRPTPGRLPTWPSTTAAATIDVNEAVRLALTRRPDVAARRVRREERDVERRLAENTWLPTLDFFSEASRDRAEGRSFEVGLTFRLPAQRRRAAGQTMKARAALARADLDLRFLEDQVRAEVQDSESAVRAARETLAAVSAEVEVARELERLERDRFDLGDSTQFRVNLRELAAADAAVRELWARADLQKALATLDAVTGRLLDPPASP